MSDLKDFYQIQDADGNPLYGHLRNDGGVWWYELNPLAGPAQELTAKGNFTLKGNRTYQSAWITPNLPDHAIVDWEKLTVRTSNGDMFNLVYIAPFDDENRLIIK
ncbi:MULTISPECIES: hypothetical protein [Klebsiella]|uniref:hypothetical protein n=1 Tax=Klebsiella TaxID=570 RepID=UPI000FD6EEC5|nr:MULTISPECIES: hypothetical protein [Klebsiella]EFE5034586.1 hypothetical protein [Escherichia coli]HCB1141094.1 hypothetical protein [Klebsiella variicola subsp. variicola]EKV3652047.1 hypothetical protein [Klebsiella quasipneumoniae]EKW1737114.1 hypothetical protein [Klebsiella pneumoniae]MBC5403178.1 hypothetical protein [Klebsiella pneumoniae]